MRDSKLETCVGPQLVLPRGVWMPRASSAAAMSRMVVAPDLVMISRTIAWRGYFATLMIDATKFVKLT